MSAFPNESYEFAVVFGDVICKLVLEESVFVFSVAVPLVKVAIILTAVEFAPVAIVAVVPVGEPPNVIPEAILIMFPILPPFVYVNDQLANEYVENVSPDPAVSVIFPLPSDVQVNCRLTAYVVSTFPLVSRTVLIG